MTVFAELTQRRVRVSLFTLFFDLKAEKCDNTAARYVRYFTSSSSRFAGLWYCNGYNEVNTSVCQYIVLSTGKYVRVSVYCTQHG